MYGDPLKLASKIEKPLLNSGICPVDGCGKKKSSRGYCQSHARRLRLYGDPEGTPVLKGQKICTAEKCGNFQWARGWCTKHYARWARNGNVEDPSPTEPGWINAQGYRIVKFNGVNTLEHRAVMSEYLDRPLLRHENVHHINGVRDDNRLENLELWSTSQPAGQRVTDKIVWAKELLATYEGFEENATVTA